MNRPLLAIILLASAACACSAPIPDRGSSSPVDQHVERDPIAQGGDLDLGIRLHSFVKAVTKSTVGIALGSSDGVRVGDGFHAWRGGDYVGRIRITAVEKNDASGVFISSSATSYAPPWPGDWVIEDAYLR